MVQGALVTVWSLLRNGVGLFLGTENHLVKIRASLEEIRDFIVIAEGSPIKDTKLMELLEKLKDAAYDAQDLLEEYEIAYRRRSEEAENSMSVRDTMTNRVHRVVTSLVTITPVIKRTKLSQRLEDIKAECHKSQLKKKVADLEIKCKEQRETLSAKKKSQVIGRDEEENEMVTLLVPTELDDGSVIAIVPTELDDRFVIAIVGNGGLGKTTLAQSVFNHDKVQKHFKPKMWICVSDNLERDNFNIKRLGNKILERATSHPQNLSDLEELWCRLREALGGKRFLLVLDDVWNEIPENWYRLGDMLLCGERGSRIVVTTRSRKVASIMSKIQPHILKPLSGDDCWSLFCQRAFGNSTEEAACSNLAPIGRQIVEKCKGNPLAVTTLGGLLCGNKSDSRWKSVRDREMWKSVRDSKMWSLPKETENGILPALRLSYNYLKPHLKQCFAFCAIFPQDYKIEKELVIKLWMAQGFIPTEQEGFMELEDIGNEIFNELVMRSFFQDVKENEYISHQESFLELERTTFMMHDLMHDLAHYVMENEYCFVHDGMSKDIFPRIRHVSSKGLGNLAASLPKAQMLRTYVMLKQDAFQFPCDVGLFKCLRALDFIDKQEVEKRLFTSLGNIQHLRYLNLSFTLIEMLPESLTSLCFLQTLILIGCKELRELPKEIVKLTNLRCLDINGCRKLTHMPPNIRQLRCLRELSNFIVSRTNKIACSGIRELQGLNLRGRLHIQRSTLINKPNITSLDLEGDAVLGDLEEDRRILQSLQPHFTELVEIKLEGCWRCNHLPPLGELPSLKVLTIDRLANVECIGDEFYGNEVSGGFPSLTELHINNMQKLKTWSRLEWKGERAFPSLVKLKIEFCLMLTTLEWNGERAFLTSLQTLLLNECHGLKRLPEGIGNLTSLRSLEIQDCPEMASLPRELQRLSTLEDLTIYGCHPSLEIQCTEDTGEDWDKIQHIPCICIEGKSYRER